MKSMRYILLAAVLSFAAACMEKEPVAPSTGDNVPVATETLTICASLGEAPESDDPVSKTVIGAESRMMEWSSKDYLYVYAPAGTKDAEGKEKTRYVFAHKKDADGNVIKGTFECADWPKGVVPTYAIFNRLNESPEAADAADDFYAKIGYGSEKYGDNIICRLRDEQKVRNGYSFAGDANIATGKVVDTDGQYSVKLKNLCGLIRFTSAEKPVSVTLRGNNNEMIAGGRVRISFNDDGTPFWRMTGDDPGSKSVTLIDDGNLWDKNNNNQYFICILPPHTSKDNDQYYDEATCSGTFSKGITLTVETASGVTYTNTSQNPVTVVRNKVVNLGRLEATTQPNNLLVLDLTLDKLPTDFPNSSATSKAGPDTWYITFDGKSYPFVIYGGGVAGGNGYAQDKTNGYFYNASAGYLQLSTTITYAYIQFPAIENMRLASVYVASGNVHVTTSNELKNYAILATPFTTKVTPNDNFKSIDGSSSVALIKDPDNKRNDDDGYEHTWNFSEGTNGTSANTSYCLQSRNGTVRLERITLTYVPVTE